MGIQIIPGINDLKSWCEQNNEFGRRVLAEYIDVYDLSTIARTTKKKLKFICSECNEQYEKSPGHITRKQGCPFCKGNNYISENSMRMLKNSNPELLSEWDYDKNTEDINKMYKTSNKKVWWKCSKCGHSWQAYISNRTQSNSGCPECAKGNQGSLMEFALYTIIKETYTNTEYQFKVNDMSFDIGIPELKVVIEYQGRYTHNNMYQKGYDVEARDLQKRKFIAQYKDITFITVNETYGGDDIKIVNNDIYFNADNNNRKYKTLKLIIDSINTILNTKIEVREDIETYAISKMQIKDIDDSLGRLYPNIASEWNTDKNGIMTPFKIKPKSNKKVWWKCSKCNHEWETSPAHRVMDGTGCPKCLVLSGSGAGAHLVIEGVNDLKTLRPDIAKEWYTEYNIKDGLELDKIAIKSNKIAWWKCSVCEKIYQDKVVYRTTRNHNCPVCNGEGINSDEIYDF